MVVKGFSLLQSAADLEALVLELGFLPFVRCGIDGFSVEESTPPDRWFVRGVEGPWEWREQVAAGGRVLYAKLFARKAGFISPEWYADLANWRRGGMDFEERYERGQIARREKLLMDLIAQRGSITSRELKAAVGAKGYDTAITALQMRTDILIQGFDHRRDAFGMPRGLGTSRYAPSEALLGEDAVCARYSEPPEASLDRMTEHLSLRLPHATPEALRRLLR